MVKLSGRNGLLRPEFSIITRSRQFVKRKSQKICTNSNPKIRHFVQNTNRHSIQIHIFTFVRFAYCIIRILLL
jgi:hypothetical protein